MNNNYSSIVGGENNELKVVSGSTILGGYENKIEFCENSIILGGYKLELYGISNATACGYFNDKGTNSGNDILFVVGNGNASTRNDAFYVDSDGNAYIYGTNSTFTGSHIYLTNDTGITIGDSIMLSGETGFKTNKSGLTNCVGLVSNIKELSYNDKISNLDLLEFFSGETNEIIENTSGDTNYWFIINVAAVGDNRTNILRGFKVCNEGGNIKNGTLLQTSSKPGYLMAQEDDIIKSKTVGKSMENVIFDENGNAKGIYGFLYCG